MSMMLRTAAILVHSFQKARCTVSDACVHQPVIFESHFLIARSRLWWVQPCFEMAMPRELEEKVVLRSDGQFLLCKCLGLLTAADFFNFNHPVDCFAMYFIRMQWFGVALHLLSVCNTWCWQILRCSTSRDQTDAVAPPFRKGKLPICFELQRLQHHYEVIYEVSVFFPCLSGFPSNTETQQCPQSSLTRFTIEVIECCRASRRLFIRRQLVEYWSLVISSRIVYLVFTLCLLHTLKYICE